MISLELENEGPPGQLRTLGILMNVLAREYFGSQQVSIRQHSSVAPESSQIREVLRKFRLQASRFKLRLKLESKPVQYVARKATSLRPKPIKP